METNSVPAASGITQSKHLPPCKDRQQENDYEDGNKEEEEEPRNVSGRARYARESQQRSDQRNDQKDGSPFQHLVCFHDRNAPPFDGGRYVVRAVDALG